MKGTHTFQRNKKQTKTRQQAPEDACVLAARLRAFAMLWDARQLDALLRLPLARADEDALVEFQRF